MEKKQIRKKGKKIHTGIFIFMGKTIFFTKIHFESIFKSEIWCIFAIFAYNNFIVRYKKSIYLIVSILVIFQINVGIKQSDESVWVGGITCTALQNKVFHFTGVLMWEVYSEGRLPYENYSNSEVVDSLNSGLRLLKPRLAPDTIHIIMEWCWKEVSAGLNCVPC